MAHGPRPLGPCGAAALWTLDNISLGDRLRPRLANVTLTIAPGVTAIIGHSGAGKSSLLNVLVGFERPNRASRQGLRCTVERGDHAVGVYWVPHEAGLWPHLTARAHLEYVAPPTAGRDCTITHLLATFDLLDRASALPDMMSQGERQRLSVARCLAADPAVAVMDEPLAHVDPARLGRYWDAIRLHLSERACSLIFATHEPAAVLAEAQRAICMAQGRVLYEGCVQSLYHDPPTRELANCLGPHNWFEPHERAMWLAGELPAAACEAPITEPVEPQHVSAAAALPRRGRIAISRAPSDRQSPRREIAPASSPCIRPEQLHVERVAANRSPLIVRSARFGGSFGELQLHHEQTQETRRIVHRPATAKLQPGDCVLLRVMVMGIVAMTLALSLAGCDRAAEPALAVGHVSYWAMPPLGAKIPAPRSITFGPDDEMLVLDTAGRVLIFDPAGKLIRQWEMPEHLQGRPEGAVYLRDGRIAVADTHYYRVVFFDREGKVSGTFGSQGDGPGQFRFPVSIVQDDRDNLYVAEYGGNDRVQKFTADGQYLLTIGGPGIGPGQFSRPQSIAWCRPAGGAGVELEALPAGLLLVADVEKGCVHAFGGDGQYLGLFGDDWPSSLAGDAAAQPVSQAVLDETHRASVDGDAHRFALPYGVAIGPDQCIYTIEYQAARVSKFAFSGQLLGRFGSPGTGENNFRTPWAVNVDSQNRIRIADTGNRRIVELRQ